MADASYRRFVVVVRTSSDTLLEHADEIEDAWRAADALGEVYGHENVAVLDLALGTALTPSPRGGQ